MRRASRRTVTGFGRVAPDGARPRPARSRAAATTQPGALRLSDGSGSRRAAACIVLEIRQRFGGGRFGQLERGIVGARKLLPEALDRGQTRLRGARRDLRVGQAQRVLDVVGERRRQRLPDRRWPPPTRWPSRDNVPSTCRRSARGRSGRQLEGRAGGVSRPAS